jgi:hypothetical protein
MELDGGANVLAAAGGPEFRFPETLRFLTAALSQILARSSASATSRSAGCG